MIFSQRKIENQTNLRLNNQDIEYVSQFKFLGFSPRDSSLLTNRRGQKV